jgi:16S rRNA (cytidine1402-2'-O)-methyltransferase
MPSISDPGHDLVRAALAEDIPVVALPGASAGITGLIASGIVPQPYLFYGFLERRQTQQRSFFEEKKFYPETQIFYESPHRLTATLANMLAVYGNREVVLVRELTKIYEEYRRGSISELLSALTDAPVKGECLLIVAGSKETGTEEFGDSPLEAVQQLLDQGVKTTEAIKQVAKARRIDRQALYQDFHKA